MSPSTPIFARSAVPRWHAWACLFIALCFFYNPFLAAPNLMMGLNVRHPASNRATVGASELQSFSPADGRDNLPTDADSAEVPVALFPVVLSQSFQLFSWQVLPPQRFFGSSLWFRPPPAL
jgi:hypothetical protein